MTDGIAEYPTEGVKALARVQSAYPKRFIFNGIEFTEQINTLKAIAK